MSKLVTTKLLYGVITDSNSLLYMRARYYSPELRRFINADIIAGEISNAITLNRYAYANGNPVSNVDPFGLEGFWSALWDGVSGWAQSLYNSAKNWTINAYNDIKNWLVSTGNDIKEFAQDVFKNVENGVLRAESLLNCKSITEYLDYSKKYNPSTNVFDLLMGIDFYIYMLASEQDFKNLEYNSAIDVQNTLIHDQDMAPYSNFKLGKQYMSDNGCEVIAVNNAMYLSGYETSLAGLAFLFETSGTVIGDNLIGGYFGSNPYSLPKVFDILDLSFDVVSFNQLSANGVYIMSYWNSTEFDSMIHTIALQKTDNGYKLYNCSVTDLSNLKQFEEGFITGYRIYGLGRK